MTNVCAPITQRGKNLFLINDIPFSKISSQDEQISVPIHLGSFSFEKKRLINIEYLVIYKIPQCNNGRGSIAGI
jgi:hypothetical protein